MLSMCTVMKRNQQLVLQVAQFYEILYFQIYPIKEYSLWRSRWFFCEFSPMLSILWVKFYFCIVIIMQCPYLWDQEISNNCIHFKCESFDDGISEKGATSWGHLTTWHIVGVY